MQVQDLMTPDPVTIHVDNSFDLAEKFMQYAHVRHLPVVEGRTLVGIVSHRDLLRALAERATEGVPGNGQALIAVKEIMRTDLVVIQAGDDVREAAKIMIDGKHGGLPVLDDDHLVGILTEADFLKFTMRLLDKHPDYQD